MSARSNSVTQAREAQCGKDVAQAALSITAVPHAKDSDGDPLVTTAEMLAYGSRCWNAGHRAGFDEGFERGQKAAASAIEAVQEVMR